MTLDPSTTHITVGRNCSNDASLTVLDLSRFLYLKELVVGDKSFIYVNELKLIGLHYLESVVIGKNSFTKISSDYPESSIPNHSFYLKACPMIKRLTIGYRSFVEYSVCQIENVGSLETIEMGDYSFYWSSLELKSILIHNE